MLEGFSIRPFSSIASNSIKTIQKPPSVNTSPISSQTSTVSLKQSDQPSSSVLLDAINNSPNLHDSSSNKTPPTTTIQLVNQSQTQAQRGQMISPKTSIIQRIQSFPPNQSIGKNVATANNASQSNQPDRSVSYKVLNQQFQTNLSKNNGSNGSEANSKSVINSENLNLLSNTINQCNTSGQSKSPEIDNLKISTSKPKAANQQTSPVSLNQSSSSGSTRKPCNCTKSMCLKLYCDCFAQGSFCVDCNCVNCFNTLDHEEERNKAIKMVLERNPQAFQSKISKFTASLTMSKAMPAQISQAPAPTSGIEDLISASVTTDELDEIQSRHVKGCNCKKSNCLKRYCECFLAKIQCSSLCKCVGCKNCDESTRTLLQLANAADLRKQQHQQEQKQQLIQQQQHSKQFFSPKGSQAGLSGSIKQSTGFKTRNLENSNENKHILMEQQQQLISRAYKSALNKSILKETCERLISIVLSEIENAEMKTDDSQDGLSEPMEIDMEKCLIEHLGSCLAEIIHSAETQSPSN
ncbi:lin-54 -like protein [Brachionus plicatilis]|uniref:Lin-54-like protein n=1 Tax=Brachionus plicatilis TaxID=10195 RepID=A0A3M7RX98_BRAPC|nr:lin-54 -like protein [Brachionus plicatilis]